MTFAAAWLRAMATRERRGHLRQSRLDLHRPRAAIHLPSPTSIRRCGRCSRRREAWDRPDRRAAATVAIGTVTTGSPGTPAAVTQQRHQLRRSPELHHPAGRGRAAGSGGGGSGGIQSAGVYHSVQNNLNYPYYSVNNPNSSATESGLTAAAYCGADLGAHCLHSDRAQRFLASRTAPSA